MTQTFTVAGLNCQGCVKHVTEALGALPGVQSVQVELGTKAASTVHVEAGRSLSDVEVTEALADEGDYTLVR
jgi:copper chaperone CopZ